MTLIVLYHDSCYLYAKAIVKLSNQVMTMPERADQFAWYGIVKCIGVARMCARISYYNN